MPFITEEIWQYFKERKSDEALIVSKYPDEGDFDATILESFEVIKEIISSVRNLRKQKNISFKEKLDLSILKKETIETGFYALIRKMCNISEVKEIDEKLENALAFRVGPNEFFIPFTEEIDVEEEKSKLEQELAYHKGFLQSVQKKLANERFVNNAPEKVIEMEI